MWFFFSEKSYCHYHIKSRENDNFWLGVVALKSQRRSSFINEAIRQLRTGRNPVLWSSLRCFPGCTTVPSGLGSNMNMWQTKSPKGTRKAQRDTSVAFFSEQIFFFLSSQVVGIFPPPLCFLSICTAQWIFWCSQYAPIDTHTLTHLNESLVFPYLWELHRPCLQAASPSCYSRIWGQQDTSWTSA